MTDKQGTKGGTQGAPGAAGKGKGAPVKATLKETLKEEADTLTVQTGPGETMVKKFAKKDIKAQPQSNSIMPPGLLNLLGLLIL